MFAAGRWLNRRDVIMSENASPGAEGRLLCPVCPETELKRMRTDAGVVWACPVCRGRSVSIHPLRRRVKAAFVNELWQAARDAPARVTARRCPHCGRAMRVALAAGVAGEFEADVCLLCQFVWFDAGEPAQLPVLPPSVSPGGEERLSPRARQALALLRVQSLAERARREEELEDFSLDLNAAGRGLAWLARKAADFLLRR